MHLIVLIYLCDRVHLGQRLDARDQGGPEDDSEGQANIYQPFSVLNVNHVIRDVFPAKLRII